MNSERFELVRTNAGHHFRFRARNGRIIASSEVYSSRGAACDGLRALAAAFSADGRVWVEHGWVTVALDDKQHGHRASIPLYDVGLEVT